MSKAARTTLENLRLGIHGVTAPFSCEGTFVPDKLVTIVFKDHTRFEVFPAKNRFDQTKELYPLLDRCKPAPFGDGKKTRYDRTVRDALQLKAENGEFRVENFDPESAGILKHIQRELVPHDPNPIAAELYTINVYTEGGHFAPHKDTPRGSDMFGSLVVCLPSQFSNGKLVLNHRGVVQKFDWGSAVQSQKPWNQLHWAAFFGDVEHQIERIWSGARITLTYLLRRGRECSPHDAPGEDLAPRIQEAWQALLADQSFLPDGGILAYPCCHLYHQDARFQQKQLPITRDSVTILKGRDHLVAATALQAGLKVTFHPYMFENCADETWQLDRFPTRKEQARLGRRMDSARLRRILPIQASAEEGDLGITWIDPRPTSDDTSWQSEAEDDSGLPAAAFLHSCDYCPWGNFGNESSEVDLYTYAALHFAIAPFGLRTSRCAEPAEPPAGIEKEARRSEERIATGYTDPKERSVSVVANFTPTQGRYLSFIHAYINLHGYPPAETEIAAAMCVSPPSVNQMVKTLEKKGLILRQPGQPRALQILIPEDEIPPWNNRKQEKHPLPGKVSKKVVPPPAVPPAKLYVLMVFLMNGPVGEKFANKVMSRTIEIRGDQTLEQLHRAIFDAFDRFDEHLYEFQFGKRPFDPKGPNYGIPASDHHEMGYGDARTTTLDALDLKPERVFGYLFDFGDEWFHQVQVERIEQAIPTVTYPRVIKRMGKSPPQYKEE